MGMTGLMAPQFLLAILGLSETGMSSHTTQLFVMASSQASLAMGMYYILSAVNETRIFFQWSVPLRIINFMVFSSMVAVGVAPSRWLMVAGLELIGALGNGHSIGVLKRFHPGALQCLADCQCDLSFHWSLTCLQTIWHLWQCFRVSAALHCRPHLCLPKV